MPTAKAMSNLRRIFLLVTVIAFKSLLQGKITTKKNTVDKITVFFFGKFKFNC